MVDTNTAWHNENIAAHMMQTHFPHLVHSDHFEPLKRCIDLLPNDIESLLDLGCGKGEISDAFPQYEYCGADLPNMIQGVSKLTRPRSKYIEFDAQLSDMNFVSDFDVIVMNSFLSEIPNAEQILNKVLKCATRYVIIHRQIIKDQENIETYSTYGGLDTTVYTFGRRNFEEIITQNDFKIMAEFDTLEIQKTMLLEKHKSV